MRLWNTLHRLYRGKKGVRRADRPRTVLAVEALDQRLLPSSFQWGIGRGIELLGYSLGMNNALVSSHQVSGVPQEISITKVSDTAVSRQGHASAVMSQIPTESFSLNFARESVSLNFTRIELEGLHLRRVLD